MAKQWFVLLLFPWLWHNALAKQSQEKFGLVSQFKGTVNQGIGVKCQELESKAHISFVAVKRAL